LRAVENADNFDCLGGRAIEDEVIVETPNWPNAHAAQFADIRLPYPGYFRKLGKIITGRLGSFEKTMAVSGLRRSR
jgi:hypothetical protein